MSVNVPAIYENGVLRPLRPLSLPERAHVQIQIQEVFTSDDAAEHRQALSAALIAAGLSRETTPAAPTACQLPLKRREELARRFAEAGPVSTLIVAERREVDA